MNKNFILIIGSNSFSGSFFINYLLKKKFKILAVSRSNDLAKHYSIHKIQNNSNNDNYIFYKLNINIESDQNKIISLIKKYKVNKIINFAAQGMVKQSWDYPLDWYKTNFLSQVTLFEKFLKLNQLNKIINFTTPEVYGSTKGWINEKTPFNPSTPYAISRSSLDYHLSAYFKQYNLPIVFTRTSNVYGPGQPLYRIIPRAIYSAYFSKKMFLDGGGVSKRSFIYMEDVNEALYSILLDKNNHGETFHISTNKLISIKFLVKNIFRKLNNDFNEFVISTEERAGKDYVYSLSSTKIRKKYSWIDHISLDKGIDSTISWFNDFSTTLKKVNINYNHKK